MRSRAIIASLAAVCLGCAAGPRLDASWAPYVGTPAPGRFVLTQMGADRIPAVRPRTTGGCTRRYNDGWLAFSPMRAARDGALANARELRFVFHIASEWSCPSGARGPRHLDAAGVARTSTMRDGALVLELSGRGEWAGLDAPPELLEIRAQAWRRGDTLWVATGSDTFRYEWRAGKDQGPT